MTGQKKDLECEEGHINHNQRTLFLASPEFEWPLFLCSSLQLEAQRKQHTEAQAKIITLESSLSDRDRTSGEQSRDWELEKASLQAKVAALEQAATDESRTHADALKQTVRLENGTLTLYLSC